MGGFERRLKSCATQTHFRLPPIFSPLFLSASPPIPYPLNHARHPHLRLLGRASHLHRCRRPQGARRDGAPEGARMRERQMGAVRGNGPTPRMPLALPRPGRPPPGPPGPPQAMPGGWCVSGRVFGRVGGWAAVRDRSLPSILGEPHQRRPRARGPPNLRPPPSQMISHAKNNPHPHTGRRPRRRRIRPRPDPGPGAHAR